MMPSEAMLYKYTWSQLMIRFFFYEMIRDNMEDRQTL